MILLSLWLISCDEAPPAETQRNEQATENAERLAEQQREIDRLHAALEQRELAQNAEAQEALPPEEFAAPREIEKPASVPDPEPEPVRAIVVEEPLQTNDGIDLFYRDLQPHGNWFESDRFGYVWQPHEVRNPEWQPYSDGYWVDTENGWHWVSNEPFGWATYHYGRWSLLDRYGWVWVPGEVWAPAWVDWRIHDDYIGWAPLPPESFDVSLYHSERERWSKYADRKREPGRTGGDNRPGTEARDQIERERRQQAAALAERQRIEAEKAADQRKKAKAAQDRQLQQERERNEARARQHHEEQQKKAKAEQQRKLKAEQEKRAKAEQEAQKKAKLERERKLQQQREQQAQQEKLRKQQQEDQARKLHQERLKKEQAERAHKARQEQLRKAKLEQQRKAQEAHERQLKHEQEKRAQAAREAAAKQKHAEEQAAKRKSDEAQQHHKKQHHKR